MSMNRYANAGPIMAGLATYWPAGDGRHELVPFPTAEPMQSGVYPQHSTADLVRMIENVADQLSEVAAQMVDIRKRLDSNEVQQRTLFKNAEAVTNLVVKDVRPRLDGLERKPQLQAQQTATAQQAVTLPLKYDIDAGCWRSGSASFATDQALVDLRIQID